MLILKKKTHNLATKRTAAATAAPPTPTAPTAPTTEPTITPVLLDDDWSDALRKK